MDAEKKRILSISYDEALLATRRMLLERAGYSVTSVLGFTDALNHFKTDTYDLIIIGHSIPRHDKEALVREVKAHNSGTLLSLRRHGDNPVEGADFSIDAIEGPELVLRTVDQILGKDSELKPSG